MYNIRWDKGVLSDYYALTGEALQSFNFDCSCLNCELGCSDREHARHIDDHYKRIVAELKRAEQI